MKKFLYIVLIVLLVLTLGLILGESFIDALNVLTPHIKLIYLIFIFLLVVFIIVSCVHLYNREIRLDVREKNKVKKDEPKKKEVEFFTNLEKSELGIPVVQEKDTSKQPQKVIEEIPDTAKGEYTPVLAKSEEPVAPVVEETPVEEPVEEPKVEEVPVEELKVEETPVEEVPVEEPKVEETPVEEQVEEPKVEETPVEEEKPAEEPVVVAPVVVEEPKAEEAKIEEPVVEEPEVEEDIDLSTIDISTLKQLKPTILAQFRCFSDVTYQIGRNWAELFRSEREQNYFKNMIGFLDEAYAKNNVYPPKADLMRCFEYCDFNNVRVVIIGKFPFYRKNQADGLAFSTRKGVAPNQTTQIIIKEAINDVAIPVVNSGSLEPWAHNGVLLLNSVMTAPSDKPASHTDCGWVTFTNHVIDLLNMDNSPKVFVLWGEYAQSLKPIITNTNHLIIEAPNPSPLSAANGFYGSKPFSKINKFLVKNGIAPIDWTL